MVFGPMPVLFGFFAMTMGVDHRQDKNNQPGAQQDNQERLILPDFANEFG